MNDEENEVTSLQKQYAPGDKVWVRDYCGLGIVRLANDKLNNIVVEFDHCGYVKAHVSDVKPAPVEPKRFVVEFRPVRKGEQFIYSDGVLMAFQDESHVSAVIVSELN
tara:strand:- start:44 stop:367 length:324 start_codon:yes stop_codon:yes gene_type:complete